MRPRIYVATSVFGGCDDPEFREPSLQLIEAFARREFILVLSNLTLGELEAAPETVRSVIHRIPGDQIEIIRTDRETEILADSYIREGALSRRMRFDALHIATATMFRVDVLVSWNFKHIVNLRRIKMYNQINTERGLPPIEIRTPREVIDS